MYLYSLMFLPGPNFTATRAGKTNQPLLNKNLISHRKKNKNKNSEQRTTINPFRQGYLVEKGGEINQYSETKNGSEGFSRLDHKVAIK
jgi:hypothetical protein